MLKTVNEHPKDAARQGCPLTVTTTCNNKTVKSHDTPGGHICSDDNLVDNMPSWYLNLTKLNTMWIHVHEPDLIKWVRVENEKKNKNLYPKFTPKSFNNLVTCDKSILMPQHRVLTESRHRSDNRNVLQLLYKKYEPLKTFYVLFP